jgi:hypothetical protein
LEDLANELPTEPKQTKKRTAAFTPSNDFDIEDWMMEHGLEHLGAHAGSDCTIFPLANCPFDGSHTNGDSKIFRYSNGAIAFKCHHNSCRGKS